MNASYRPTATMQHPAVSSARREHPPAGDVSGRHHGPARVVTRHANRLLSPNIDPNNGRHARWCPCMPGYVCADHRLTR